MYNRTKTWNNVIYGNNKNKIDSSMMLLRQLEEIKHTKETKNNKANNEQSFSLSQK